MALLLLTGLVLFALVEVERCARERSDVRRLRLEPTTAIDAVREGQLVKIVGRVELVGPPLTSPVSGRPCAAYCAVIHYHDERCRHRVVREAESRAFFIRDASGRRALVRTPVVLLTGSRATLRLGAPPRRLAPWLRRLLHRHGFVATPVPNGTHYAERCDETALLPADEVAVVGVAHREPDPAPDERSLAASYRTPSTRVAFAVGASAFKVALV